MKTLFMDFETVWDRSLYSIGRMGLEAYIRDRRFGVHMVGMAWGDGEPVVHHAADVAGALAAVEWDDTLLVSHNAPFDGSILAWRYGHRPLLHVDTLALSRVCYPRVTGHKLGEMAEFLGLGAKGAELALSDGLMEPGGFPNVFVARKLAEYCCTDVRLTRALYRRLLQAIGRLEELAQRPPGALREVELGAADDGVRMTTEPALVLDQAILEPMAAAEEKAVDGRLRKADVFAAELRALGIEPEMKHGKRGPIPAFAKTDSFMRGLLGHESPAVRALAAARLGAQGDNEACRAGRLLEIARRGPLPAMLNPNQAHTGRDTGGGGINLQNLPRGSEMRRAIRAPEGHRLVVADLAQIEVRVLATIAGEEWLVDAFRSGADPYKGFASRMYGISVEQVSKEARQTAKSAYLGLTYGMGHGVGRAQGGYIRFVRGKGGEITEQEAVMVHAGFRKAHPAVARFWAFGDSLLRQMAALAPGAVAVRTEMPGVVIRLAKERIHLPSGRVLWYPDLRNEDRRPTHEKWAMRRGKVYGGKVVENIVQAVARDVLWAQMARIRARVGHVARCVLRIHDEAVMLCREQDAPFVKGVMEEEMVVTPDWIPGLPLAVEAATGDTWLDAK